LLTLVNIARRTFLAGIEVTGLADAPVLTSLATSATLAEAVRQLGGRTVEHRTPGWPGALIGDAAPTASEDSLWRLTWDGWRGGVLPASDTRRLPEGASLPLSPMMAAASCAAEAFAYHAGDHIMAGRRAAGLSLWAPGNDWLSPDHTEPPLTFLPSRMWLIGLGNLGQAFAWMIGSLPYREPSKVQLILQDFDRITRSNDSTSVLSWLELVGWKKTRVVADWLEARGFQTDIERNSPYAASTTRWRALRSTRSDSASSWKPVWAQARRASEISRSTPCLPRALRTNCGPIWSRAAASMCPTSQPTKRSSALALTRAD
jgi:hypothetical protein